MAQTLAKPGVYREDVFLPLAAELRTGVPAFLGFAEAAGPGSGAGAAPRAVTLWPQYEELFGAPGSTVPAIEGL